MACAKRRSRASTLSVSSCSLKRCGRSKAISIPPDAMRSRLLAPETKRRGAASRPAMRKVLFAVVPALALIVGAWVFVLGGRYVTSDNAYVRADIVSVAPDVAGKLVAVAVRENQPVRAGDLLVTIDNEPLRVAV